jgi:glycosyltransferase involved in cell wall biosynthesis
VTPIVSVIVPLHRMTDEARQCLDTVVRLPGGRHELLVVSDQPIDGLPDGARAIVTGGRADTSPAEKRDAALPHVRGSVCAFLDDDAYPSPDWLDRALARLADPDVAAVGGPGVTPPGSPLAERVAGAFYESPFGSGGLRYRFVPNGPVRDVDDFPAYNLFVRTDALRAIGGWASRFYGGEDTAVCLRLVEAGHRIVYDPAVVVHHFRRPVFRPLMRQLANVGRHRGYFVRTFPATSARPLYFAPSIVLVAGLPALVWALRRPRRLLPLAAVAAVIAGAARCDGQDGTVAAVLPLALLAGHAAYGVGFLRGLTTRRIEAM